MLSQTSELAIKTLVFLGLEGSDDPISPRQIAESFQCSSSYLAKTVGMLVRAGVLRSIRGAHGGVVLAKRPEQITLLAIVEACQGLLIANYCQDISSHKDPICGFHQAMKELHSGTVKTLSRWTLKDLIECPVNPGQEEATPCKMYFPGWQKCLSEKGGGK